MGSVDVERQSLNVFRMKLLGAKVTAVDAGSRSLKDALNEALRDWIATVAQHLLPDRHRRRTASVPDDRARLPIGDRTRGAPPDSQARGAAARRAGRLRQRRLQRDRALLSVHRRHGRAHDRRRGGRPGAQRPVARRDDHRRQRRRAARQSNLPAAGRARPDSRNPFDRRRARLSRASARSSPGSRRAGAPSTSRSPTPRRSTALQLLSETEGIIPALESAHAVAYAARLAPTMSQGAA